MLPDLAHGQDIFGSPELRTKMKILHAVDKSLDRITIAEICENAGISRQTFYRHFRVIGKKVCPEPNRNPCDKGRLHAGHSIAQQCPSAPPLHLFR